MKKFLKWLIPCLVACFMVAGLVQTASFTFAEGQDDSVSEGSDVPTPTHKKTIEGDENGYTLTLNVMGQKQTIPGEKPKVDVVLVIDNSNSMYSNNDMTDPTTGSKVTRMEALKKIVTGSNGLSQTILGNPNLDARIAVVSYSGSRDSSRKLNPPSSNTDTPNNDAKSIPENNPWIGNLTDGEYDEETAKAAVDSVNENVNSILSDDGGTNCEAGLRKAADVLGSARAEAQKYVIFLSDGSPTFYYANGKDYYESSSIEYVFKEQDIPEGTLDPNDIEEITPQDYGNDIFYYTYPKWENGEWVSAINWYSISLQMTGWHYIEEEQLWKYGKYSNEYVTKQEVYDAGITLGNGSSDTTSSEVPVPEGKIDGICSSRAYDAVLKLSGLTGFYTVGVSGSASSDFLTNLKDKSTAVNKDFFPGTDTAELTKAFSDIASSILDRSLTVSNVTITDSLSDYVNLSSSVVDGIVTNPVISIKNDKNEDVTNDEKDAAGMDVYYNDTTKTVTCDFNDGYSLKENYTYSVSFRVVPSQKAYTEFSKNNGSYGNELEGFESNGKAELTYRYGDSASSQTKTVRYVEKPVIHVSANNLSVTKEVKGAYANKNDKFKFTLTLKDEKGNPVNDTLGGIKFVDGKYEFTLKDNEKVEFNNLPRNYSYKVEEDSYDGYETTYLTGKESDSNKPSSEVPGATFTYGNKDEVSVTVTNTAEAVPLTGITDNTPKGLGLIGSIVVEIAAIAFVLKKKRQLKM